MEKTINEKLDQFLYAIEDYISVNAEYYTKDVKVIYMTQWQKHGKKMFARGVVEIGEAHYPGECGAYYPVELRYNINTGELIIKSPAFLFYLSSQDIEEFLEQAVKSGDDE